MTRRERNAVLAAFHESSEGRSVGVGSVDFWAGRGIDDPATRRDILARAAAMSDAAAAAGSGGYSGTLADTFGESGYGVNPRGGGPLETPTAKVYVKVGFEAAGGDIFYRTYSRNFPWGTSVEAMQADMDSWIGDMEDRYGASHGIPAWETLTIY